MDIQNLNQYSSELRNASPVTAEALTPQVKDINTRWNKLLSDMNEREVSSITLLWMILEKLPLLLIFLVLFHNGQEH